ncbi:methyl-accepting chemotaxis protein [Propionivibrio dicarboxylicus]|uniref:Methyl-accepting chemotaxis protein n=1 Tax=Propionivibrio dicarboxylicus TaxID=83767 RepID=A0A1G8C1B1_9RHOO|nr:methyl-accepting chemotaxis protein [Propionivibrio dicarboxylicus]SDH39195.1 methyl-accepting chemotaxis protein [Propionivibrio dicarboxylicus]
MTLSQRILALIAAAMVCLAVLTGVGYVLTSKVYEKANYGNENTVPSVETLHRAIAGFSQIRVQVLYHILSSHMQSDSPDIKAEIQKKIDDAFVETEKALKDYEALISNDEDRKLLEADRAALAGYKRANEPILAASSEYRTDAAMEEVKKASDAPRKVADALNMHVKFNTDLGNKEAAEAQSAKSTSTLTALLVLLGAAVILGGIGFTILRSMNTRLAEANTIAEQIANGNLGARATADRTSNDEIGHLLGSLEKMRHDLAITIGEIIANAESVANGADQLSASAKQVASSTEQQSSATTSAAAAVEEMTVSIDHIGNSAGDASQRALDAGHQAEQSGSGVETAAQRISDVAEHVEHTAQQLQTLSEQVQQIGSITVVIREVADQTNLLALNAAIEAARAGEQGRGFAVVADEVRKLAERTTASIQEISEVIGRIQEGATAAVDSMQTSRHVVTDVVTTARDASISMGEIRASADNVRHAIESISDALREQKTSSTELARNVEAIAQMSEENSVAVESVAQTVQQLVELSNALKTTVSRFHL